MNPIVLGIDTSGTWCSAALLHSSGTAARRMEVGNAHTDHLLAMIDAVLAEAGVRLDECGCVAFGAGPGSFTGLRVACAVAQGLAFGVGVPVAAVGTLDAIAWSVVKAEPRVPQRMLVAQDARMGEVYWSVLEDGVATAAALDVPARLRVLLADALPEDQPGLLPVGCGNAWSIYPDPMSGLVARVVPRLAADAVEVAELGARAAVAGKLIGPADAAPLYVRNRVAETTAERAARKPSPVVAA